MSTINLNDAKYEVSSVKVFNGGVAGIVKNCKIRVERKKADDAENAPKYKVILTDGTGAEINKGYFANFEKSTPKALDFFVKEMKHLANMFEVKLPEAVESYEALLDATMAGCRTNMEGKLVNVGVSYGTTDYPKRYLEIASAFAITPITETPYLGVKALMVRPEPTPLTEQPSAPAGPGNELPW